MSGKQLREQFDQMLEGRTTIAEVIKDLPLYEQILDRGQLMGKMMSRNLIEVVRRQAHEIDRLGASEFREVEVHGQTIDERDRMHEVADSLALAISEHFRVPIGEHSNMNCPWNEAEKILLGEYVTDTDEGRELTKVKERLEWLVNEEAIVAGFDGQFWLEWPKSEEVQTLRFNSVEAAIGAAIAASDPLREATSNKPENTI